jgi:hypothetical protein
MFKALTGWLKRRFTTPKAPPVKAASIPGLILICAAYDPFTEHAVEWMKEVPTRIPLPSTTVIQLHERPLTKGDVRVAMASIDVPGRIEIFCGHGDYNALLGPPESGADVIVDGIEHSIIYDTEMIPFKEGSLVAFSCRSAKILGRAYGTFVSKGFVGFNNDLPLDYSSEFMEQLREIFNSIVMEVLVEGRVIPKHRGILEGLYDRAIFYFLDGDGRKASKNFLFQMMLVEHRICINLYSTYAS